MTGIVDAMVMLQYVCDSWSGGRKEEMAAVRLMDGLNGRNIRLCLFQPALLPRRRGPIGYLTMSAYYSLGLAWFAS